jgi:hypothetical protein
MTCAVTIDDITIHLINRTNGSPHHCISSDIRHSDATVKEPVDSNNKAETVKFQYRNRVVTRDNQDQSEEVRGAVPALPTVAMITSKK